MHREPWRKLQPGYTYPGTTIRPVCCHSSPVRPGSDVWTVDCEERAVYRRVVGGIEEYMCAEHATGPIQEGQAPEEPKPSRHSDGREVR